MSNNFNVNSFSLPKQLDVIHEEDEIELTAEEERLEIIDQFDE